ncbi:type VI secretion protein DotU [Pseudomonas sp. M47T1]|uniref:DotU family type IV/VI secretion system protein n=1 Tax=Pseudomonas sp. M47T1 TaxID=1179778 RepID=UPI000260885D|nr:DotU/TssL family secretion system protein [Pseudomonas sp. M47T1]EIK95426.1 type VI secretion protein DotU [Pseudomonas sp. M47T1]
MLHGYASQAFDNERPAPLTLAFRQAWLQWQADWDELDKAVDDPTPLVEKVLDITTRLTRRLWRSGFAAVGDAAAGQAKAMVYAFVALLDETLVFTPWPGQLAWQHAPLEAALYNTRQAGERVPLAIKRLLDERSPHSRDLANVYLQCLILGFKGRLRGEAGAALHEKWRHGLFALVFEREPDLQTTSDILERPSRVPPTQLPLRESLPDGLRLGLAIVAVALVMLGVGQWFWHDIGQALEPALRLSSSLHAQGPGA